MLLMVACCGLVSAAAQKKTRPALIWAGMLAVSIIGLNTQGHDDHSSDAIASSSVQEAQATPAATEAPTPQPDMHAKRQAYHDYWNKVAMKIAFADSTRYLAMVAVEQSDLSQASGLIGKGIDYAKDAENAASEGAPEDWADIASKLGNCANNLTSSLTSARKYMDDHLPSEGADAREFGDQATSDLDAAAKQANANYIAMGGKRGDLGDVEELSKSLTKAVLSVAGASTSDGQ